MKKQITFLLFLAIIYLSQQQQNFLGSNKPINGYCQQDFYLNSNQDCEQCPNFTTNYSTNQQISDCNICISRQYYLEKLSSPNSSAICKICPNNSQLRSQEGKFKIQTQDVGKCETCIEGYYIITGSYTGQGAFCQKCPNNTYNNLIQSEMLYSCNLCADGFYNSQKLKDQNPICQLCPNNSQLEFMIFIQSAFNPSDCKQCLQGYFNAEKDHSKPLNCQKCPQGTTTQFGYSGCICSLTQYQTQAQFTSYKDCLPCPKGSTRDSYKFMSGGESQCSLCLNGYYLIKPHIDPVDQNTPGKGAICQICPNNSYSLQPGTSISPSSCSMCLLDYYMQKAADKTNSAQCQACPNNTGTLEPVSFPGDENQCSVCAAGYYLSKSYQYGKLAQCIQCPIGSTTNSGINTVCYCYDSWASWSHTTNSCQCMPGTKGSPSTIQNSQGCIPCPQGQYLSTDGTCFDCPAGTYSKFPGSSSCTKCPKGQQSGKGSTFCQECPSYAPILEDSSGCKCGDKNSIFQDNDCVCFDGFNSVGSASGDSYQCVPCLAGQFSNQSTYGMCTECPSGTYATGTNNASCSLCPVGYYSDQPASERCTQCTKGSYTSETGNTSCKVCPNGYPSLVDFSGCKCNDINAIFIGNKCICKEGYEGTPNETQAGLTGCIACPSGKYSDLTTQGQCVSCPAGTYQSNNGQSSCQKCGEGQYASGTGNTSCSNCGSTLTNTDDFLSCKCIDQNSNQPLSSSICVCNQGYFGSPAQTKNSSSRCVACSAGHFVESGQCSPCPAGEYSSGTANAQCTRCPAGSFSSGVGSTSCVTCIKGSYNLEDFSGCKCYDPNSEAWNPSTNICLCKSNYYGDASKAQDAKTSQCISCPSDYTSKAGAAKTQNDCQAPQNQQNSQMSFSQILGISFLIVMILF